MAGINRTTVWNMNAARDIAQWLGGALAVLAIAWSQLASEGSARLTAVEVLPMQGSTLQIRLRTDGTAPHADVHDRPSRAAFGRPAGRRLLLRCNSGGGG